MPELHLLSDVLVLFALGVAVVLVMHRVRVPPIVGFLLTGVLCGPYGLSLVGNVEEVEALAELGVILLLFTIGIEVSLAQLTRMRRFLLGAGGLQVFGTLAVGAVAARAFGVAWAPAVFIGMLLALSSTAIVLRLLADAGELDAPHGRAVLGILIFQDLCVVPFVLAAPFLGGGGMRGGELLHVVGMAALFIGGAIVAARFVVPRLLSLVAATRRRELFVLTVVLLCLGTAWASAAAGLSLALGAFIAGLVISESEYSHQALGEVLPMRELFNSLFFISIGMLLDVRTVLAHPALVLGVVAAVVVVKLLLAGGAAAVVGQPFRVALLAGLALAQIGEFSFVLAREGVGAGLLDPEGYQLFLAAAVATMTLTPFLRAAAPRVAAALEPRVPAALRRGRATLPALAAHPPMRDHVVVMGYGLNGRSVVRACRRADVPVAVIEINPERVRAAREVGVRVVVGDAVSREVLEHAGVPTARVVVVAISDPIGTRAAVDHVRRLNEDAYVLTRTRYVQEIAPLQALGTSEVVSEEFEAMIEIFTRVLERYLVPRETIEAETRSAREALYEMRRAPDRVRRDAAELERFVDALSLDVFTVAPGSRMADRALLASGLREGTGASVVAIQRGDDRRDINPSGRAELYAGELALVLGTPEQLDRAAAWFAAPDDGAAGPAPRAGRVEPASA